MMLVGVQDDGENGSLPGALRSFLSDDHVVREGNRDIASDKSLYLGNKGEQNVRVYISLPSMLVARPSSMSRYTLFSRLSFGSSQFFRVLQLAHKGPRICRRRVPPWPEGETRMGRPHQLRTMKCRRGLSAVLPAHTGGDNAC